jgi:dCTP deaminase
MFAVQPVRIYPGTPICQIFYHTLEGEITEYATGKYQDNNDIQPSLLYQEWEEKKKDPQMRLSFGQEIG